jgi:cytochrome c
MAKLRLIYAVAFCSAIFWGTIAAAQMPLPAPKPPDGATLFKQQCATCHTLDPAEPLRQGPPLAKVVGRPAGKVDGFHYSPGLAKADFVWDEAKLDTWLTNPQAMIPDAFMAYRQAKPETRAAIIAYLKGT